METIGDLLAVLDDDEQRAWHELHQLARAVAGHMAPNRAYAEDATQEACLRAFQDDAAALKRAAVTTPVATWVRGVLRRIMYEEHRSVPRVLGTAATEHATSEPRASSTREPIPGQLYQLLTPRQYRAWLLVMERGLTIAEASRALGIAWTTCQDRLRRAAGRIRTHLNTAHVPPWKHRAWALDCLPATKGRARSALDLYLGGASYRLIAQILRSARGAVRKAIARLRRRPPPP